MIKVTRRYARLKTGSLLGGFIRFYGNPNERIVNLRIETDKRLPEEFYGDLDKLLTKHTK